jgi:hypothetical protein
MYVYIHVCIVMHRLIARQGLSKHVLRNEYAAIEDIHCYAMDVFSAWSDPRLYKERPTIIHTSFEGVVWSEVESVRPKIVICEML